MTFGVALIGGGIWAKEEHLVCWTTWTSMREMVTHSSFIARGPHIKALGAEGHLFSVAQICRRYCQGLGEAG